MAFTTKAKITFVVLYSFENVNRDFYVAISVEQSYSFKDEKEKLPIDFTNEEAELDGQWLNSINFEFFTVNVLRDGVPSRIIFSRGEITATEELYEIYLNTKWNRN